MDRVYKEYLGIATGDIVSTSYGTGPYEVWSVSPPKAEESFAGSIVRFPWQVVSLVLIKPGVPPKGDIGLYWINDIRRRDDGRYFSNGNEIYVTKTRQDKPMQMGLFSSSNSDKPVPHDYRQPGVNYDCLDLELWHCPKCQKDFNALTRPSAPTMVPGDPRGWRPLCPDCNHWPDAVFIIKDGEAFSAYSLTLHTRMIEQYRQFHPERIAYFLEACGE